MNISPGNILRGRFLLAIASGLLLAVSFPNASIAGFAWIAPGLMLAAALGRPEAERFRLGYVAGLAHYLTSLDWLLRIPYRWHGIPLGPAFGWLALSAYLALFPATWVWLALRLLNSKVQVPSAPAPDWASSFRQLSETTWTRRMIWTLYCGASWVALEMVLVRLLGGFPWNLLGVSQYQLGPLIQIASLAGIYGVSFLLVWTSTSLLSAVAAMLQQPGVRGVWLKAMMFPMLAMAAAFAWGFYRIATLPPAQGAVRVTLVQPSIPQTLIWDSANDRVRFDDLIRLSEEALTNQTDLLVWPEAALPKMLRYDKDTFQAVTRLAREHRVWMIVGSDDAEPRAGAKRSDDADYFNSAFLVSPDGELVERYAKRNLVMFGEYIPLVRWLPFLRWFTPIDGGFTAGTRPGRFLLNLDKERRPPIREESISTNSPAFQEPLGFAKPRLVKLAPLICYEDTFPQLGRDGAGADTDVLVNLTNDGWFGQGAAQWQQAASAAFRAVENGLPLVRCANTGLTCWIDATGSIRDVFTDPAGQVYGPGFETVLVPLRRVETVYHRYGDWFGWGCVGLVVFVWAKGRCFRGSST